jgi:hypothetical protein
MTNKYVTLFGNNSYILKTNYNNIFSIYQNQPCLLSTKKILEDIHYLKNDSIINAKLTNTFTKKNSHIFSMINKKFMKYKTKFDKTSICVIEISTRIYGKTLNNGSIFSTRNLWQS